MSADGGGDQNGDAWLQGLLEMIFLVGRGKGKEGSKTGHLPPCG